MRRSYKGHHSQLYRRLIILSPFLLQNSGLMVLRGCSVLGPNIPHCLCYYGLQKAAFQNIWRAIGSLP